jgi:hypothetical protein
VRISDLVPDRFDHAVETFTIRSTNVRDEVIPEGEQIDGYRAWGRLLTLAVSSELAEASPAESGLSSGVPEI